MVATNRKIIVRITNASLLKRLLFIEEAKIKHISSDLNCNQPRDQMRFHPSSSAFCCVYNKTGSERLISIIAIRLLERIFWQEHV